MITAGDRVVIWSRDDGALYGTVRQVLAQPSGRPLYHISIDRRGDFTVADTIVFALADLPYPLCHLSRQIGTA